MNVANQAQHAKNYQIQRDNVVQQSRHDEDKYSGKQSDQRGEAKMEIHDGFLCSMDEIASMRVLRPGSVPQRTYVKNVFAGC
jgi:hypothetical protein